MGFIAQEVHEVYPHLKPEIFEKEYYGVDYGKFTPFLWSAVQELISRVELLESKLSYYENK